VFRSSLAEQVVTRRGRPQPWEAEDGLVDATGLRARLVLHGRITWIQAWPRGRGGVPFSLPAPVVL
jgi:hypothetical protein